MNKTQLRKAIEKLPALPNELPAFSWLERRQTIRNHILNDEYNYLDWAIIKATMDTTGSDQKVYLDYWQEQTRLNIGELDSIVEFGGGFGAMAELCFKSGFSGKYTIIDFPELLLLQQYRLQIDNIRYVDTGEPYKLKADLLIAVCSLSEVDHDSKDKFFSQVEFVHHLIVYQPFWVWNNVVYFRDFGQSQESPIYQNHRIIVK